MIALDVIAALGGLCGAAALARPLLQARAQRRRAFRDLQAALNEWDALDPEAQADARLELADRDLDRGLPRDLGALLGDIRWISERYGSPQQQSAGLGGFLRSLSEGSADRPRSEADLLQGARLALRGPIHD